MIPILIKKTSPYFFVLALGISTGCTNSAAKEKTADTKKQLTATKVTDTTKITAPYVEQIDSDTAEYHTFFVVIVDTSMSYTQLQTRMYALSDTCKIAVDTMERFYNANKNLIALPDNYDDDIYAGDYYPRRFPSNTLSLEYLNLYKKTTEKMIALVAGIYQQEKSADSALASIRNLAKDAFVVKSDIYVGCLH
jgi:hypothetical protein